MNPFIDELSNAVLKRPLQDCSTEELQRLTREYPFFGPGQLLLAKKLSAENVSAYKDQVQKTSLYFPNRMWLDHLLNDHDSDTGVATTTDDAGITDNNYPPAQTITEEPMKSEISIEHPKGEIETQQDSFSETIASSDEPVAETLNNQDEPELVVTINKWETTDSNQAGTPPINPDPGTAGQELVFEPYHTVDYFASQGIKAREEEKPKDQFSVQLRSFTEWLKTLKRVSVTEIAVSSDPVAEKKVEQMAEYSLAERHVITEAMAEVWKKQGNKAKAEEIYNKLSLLDPSKTAYFAAKIEELKKTS